MKFYAAIVGGLAVLSAALPAAEDSKSGDLSVVGRAADVAVPAVGFVPGDAGINVEMRRDGEIDAELEKRRGSGHHGSGSSGSEGSSGSSGSIFGGSSGSSSGSEGSSGSSGSIFGGSSSSSGHHGSSGSDGDDGSDGSDSSGGLFGGNKHSKTPPKATEKPEPTEDPTPKHTTKKDDEHTTKTHHTTDDDSSSHSKTKTTDSRTHTSSTTASHTTTSGTHTGSSTTSGTETGSTTTSGTSTSLTTSVVSTSTNTYCGPKMKATSSATGKTTKSTGVAKPPKGSSSTSTSTSGKGKDVRSIGERVGQAARGLYYRAAHLVGRADAINLSAQQIEDARTEGRTIGAATEVHTGKYRWLKLGTPMVDVEPGQLARTPNDMSFDTWSADGEFFRTIDGLTGCTAVMVTSPKGVFSGHLWEQFIMDKNTGNKAVMDNLKKGSADKRAKSPMSDFVWDFKAQFGLTDYGSDKVASGAWSGSKDDIHIAIVTPSNDPKGLANNPKNTGIQPQSQWASSLKYAPQVQQILSTIKSSVGNVPDSNVVLYAYHQQSEAESAASMNTDGTMTGYLSNGNYAVYGETTKMFEFPITPSGGSSTTTSSGSSTTTGAGSGDCDSSPSCFGISCCIM